MTYTTDSQLKALNIASGKKEQYIKDGSTTNLFILLRETSKTFIFRYEINGSCKKITIGQYPSISLAEARQKANEFKALLAQGIDPREYKNEHELIFKDVAQKWLKEKAKQKLSSLKKTEARLNNHILPKLSNIKIKDLKRDKLINCILEVELKAYQLGEYLFSINSKIMSENTLNKAIKILGFGDEATFHGFRGLFSTICHDNTQDHGLTSEVIELCLAHEDNNKVRSAYNKSERLQEKADLMEWYGNYINNLKK